jgi:uncharacterized membrane protein YagU involved in acid resistance
MGLARSIAAGAVGGAAGAALMVPLYEGAKRIGLLLESPPVRVVDRAAEQAAEATEAGGPVEPDERFAAAVGSHLLYGAAAGVVYSLTQDELELPTAVAAPAYGLLLWVAGYVGWMPALGILPRPWRQRTGDALVPVVAHLVFALGLGLGDAALRRR